MSVSLNSKKPHRQLRRQLTRRLWAKKIIRYLYSLLSTGNDGVNQARNES